MINVYCDESCHLELSKSKPTEQKSMVLGGVSCPIELVRSINQDIKNIKEKHGLSKSTEFKWTKVSKNKINFYKEIIEYFFSNKNLKFRAIVFQDKSKFNYKKYSHNDLYYIMYFYLLREMIDPNNKSNIYIDKKDTRGGKKINKLKECLCNSKLDFNLNIIEKIQIIDSKDSEIMQVADLLIGSMSYANRGYDKLGYKSIYKKELVELVRKLSGYNLCETTLRQEYKFNIFIWEPNYSI